METLQLQEENESARPSKPPEGKAAVVKRFQGSLERSHLCFHDKGDGRSFSCSGARAGVGYVTCDVSLGDDGRFSVLAAGIPIPAAHERDLAKLARSWNRGMVIPGLLLVREGREGLLVFQAGPFELADADPADVAGMALASMHRFASAAIALEAGLEPWKLVRMNRPDGGGGGRAPEEEMLRTLLGLVSDDDE